MKIALSLSGLPRIFPISAASWGRIIGRYRPDVYVHSWYEPGDIQGLIENQLGWVFKPTKLLVESVPSIDVSPYPDRHWPMINVDRSLSMWKGIQASYEMVKSSGIEYDLIIRGRMDWHVHDLMMADFPGIVIPYDTDKIPLQFVYRGVSMHGLNDHFAYGHPQYMDRYVKTLDEILDLYSNEGVDYCPENFLAASLAKQGVPVMLQHMEHCLVRS